MDASKVGDDASCDCDDRGAVQHLIELGYSDPLEFALRRQQQAGALEQSLHEAQRMIAAGDFAGAVGRLEQLAIEAPNAPGPHHLLAQAYMRCGVVDHALAQLRWLEVRGYEHAEFALLRAKIALQRRELAVAYDEAEYARRLKQPLPAAEAILGEIHFRQGRLLQAENAYSRALDADLGCVPALAGMAATALRNGDFAASIDWSLRAVERDDRQPFVHYRLGLALSGIGRRVEAIAALEQTARLNPQLAGPHRWIARLCDGFDEQAAAEHRRLAREILAGRRRQRSRA